MNDFLNILITRPLNQANNLYDEILQMGNKPILFPTIQIVDPVNARSLEQGINQLNAFDIAIFTSVNAAIKTLAHWPSLTHYPVLVAIGPATARALAENNLKLISLPQTGFTSETLLDLPLFQHVQGKRVIIFTGENARTFLPDTLRQRGAQVYVAYAYRRIMPSEQALLSTQLDLIICSSAEGLRNLVAMIDPDSIKRLFKCPIIVISEKMKELAKQLGFEKTAILAENATDKAVLIEIKRFSHNCIPVKKGFDDGNYS